MKTAYRRFGPSDFVRESNRIEGILREPTADEVDEHLLLINQPQMTLPALLKFVEVYQPDAKLRGRLGMDVRVGNHMPIPGGPEVLIQLEGLLVAYNNWHSNTPFILHCRYENLHPFTDCNGRSGRALWVWHMLKIGGSLSLGFLHTFYYQSLSSRNLGNIPS